MLRAENVSARYFRKTGNANHFYAVKNASLELRSGEIVLLMGCSGSGKTTLLHMLAGLLTPVEGRVWLDDTELYNLPDGELSRLRNAQIGVIPQGRSAVDTLTVLENVLLPQQLRGERGNEAGAAQWLDLLGIAALRDSRPAELSGGELRRMAIARALAGNPEIILADEPTGDLDDENTERVLSILRREAVEGGKAVLLVTHDSEALSYGTRVCRMESGILKGDEPAACATAEAYKNDL
ncbi:MAG: ABC transporter ATP-binding protein [Clostridia bacterium]|nr:ABC transporter ATP-binding protein [Clostridia bacterium]